MAAVMEWREIPGFPGLEVSEHGDIRRAGVLTRLRGWIDADGYVAYKLRDAGGERREVKAHVAVALAFIGPKPTAEHEAAHGDGSRLHNHHTNLRWATSLENHQDRREHGTGPVGERNPRAKITEADVIEIRREYRAIKARGSGRSVAELDARYGLHRATIIDIAMGRSWAHVPMPSVVGCSRG